MPAEVIETIFEVIEGGASVESATILEFPTDVVVGETLSGTTTSVTLGNGVATEVSQLTVETAAGATETAGVGLLAIDVGVAGAAAAPILGILAGVGLYNLAPDFWTSVADKLWEAGETVGGKVRAFLNPKTKQVGLSATTLEIFKQAFLQAGIFEKQYGGLPNSYLNPNTSPFYNKSYTVPSNEKISPFQIIYTMREFIDTNVLNNNPSTPESYGINTFFWEIISYLSQFDLGYGGLEIQLGYNDNYNNRIIYAPFSNYAIFLNGNNNMVNVGSLDGNVPYYRIDVGKMPIKNYPVIKTFYFNNIEYCLYLIHLNNFTANSISGYFLDFIFQNGYFVKKDNSFCIPGVGIVLPNENLQPDATYPTADKTIPETYPNYIPWELPENLPVPSIYPVEIPVVNPDPSQEEAQNPDPLPDNQPVADWLIDNLPQPNPTPEPPSDGGETEPPDPPDPNPDPEPGPLPVIPVMPDTVNAHKMFTVYNPTLSQLNDFGGWLWTSDIIDNIVKIWAGDPIQGILSLRKVYAKPVTGSMKNIVVGYLDSGVDALEVSNQFVTIECGTVQVAEQKHNATDYPPYTSLHLYLPFIGVVELDPNEFMNGSITVTYHVDVYTGSCLAEVKATRSADMPNATILYTFTGNASQELPLSSSNFSGAISSLVSLATAGIAVASGGGLIAAGATASAIHSLTHEMIHINRSGNLSSNAGIMGSRIPYLIIGMRHGYDANAYNELYGYPANKTVYIGNCKGYTRVKAGRLRTKATEAEKKEIMQLLEKGVIL